MRKAIPRPIIMLPPPRTAADEPFHAVKQWVNGGYGHVEIGDQEGFGFVVGALDYGGQVLGDRKSRTFAGATTARVRGSAEYFERGIEVEGGRC